MKVTLLIFVEQHNNLPKGINALHLTIINDGCDKITHQITYNLTKSTKIATKH